MISTETLKFRSVAPTAREHGYYLLGLPSTWPTPMVSERDEWWCRHGAFSNLNVRLAIYRTKYEPVKRDYGFSRPWFLTHFPNQGISATVNSILDHDAFEDIGISKHYPVKHIDCRPTFLISWDSDSIIRYRNSVRVGSPWWHRSVSIGNHRGNRRATAAHAGARSNSQLAKSNATWRTVDDDDDY